MKDPDELEAVVQTAQTTATPEENAAAHEARSYVDSALEALPEEYRVVFVLRAVEELSTAETAESLELTPENVKVRLHRAKAMLKRELLARAGPGIASMYPFMGERCDRMVMNVMSRIRWNCAGDSRRRKELFMRMKTVRRLLVLAFAGAALWATSALAADQTWKGTISDSNCGHSHKAAVEHAGKALSDHDCTVACVKGGAKYVFVAGGKVYDIANQDFAGLDTNAGKPVQVAGTMNGNAITIAKVTAGK